MASKRYEQPVDRWILFITLALIVFGLVAVSSASVVLSYERFGHPNYYFFRQIIFAGIGLLAMYAVSRIDYHFWRKWARPLMLLGLLFLGLVLLPNLGFRVGESRSWFNTGLFFIQPSEFVKLALIFYLASWFERKKDAENNFWFGVLPPLLVVAVTIGLVVLEPDLGMAVMLAVIMLIVLVSAGVRWPYLLSLVGAGFAALWILIKTSPHRAARIITFLDPSLDPRGIGYHINQALLAIGSGGLLGYGFGQSRQKHKFLPEPIGDSIFAVMAEELGFIRIAILVMLFCLLGFLGFRLARRAPDKFGSLVAVGITGWIAAQALINIGAISGLLPLTGITLPFISYGGSSLLALCIGIGVLLNISRQRL